MINHSVDFLNILFKRTNDYQVKNSSFINILSTKFLFINLCFRTLKFSLITKLFLITRKLNCPENYSNSTGATISCQTK